MTTPLTVSLGNAIGGSDRSLATLGNFSATFIVSHYLLRANSSLWKSLFEKIMILISIISIFGFYEISGLQMRFFCPSEFQLILIFQLDRVINQISTNRVDFFLFIYLLHKQHSRPKHRGAPRKKHFTTHLPTSTL